MAHPIIIGNNPNFSLSIISSYIDGDVMMDELKLFNRCRHDAENEVGVLYFLHGLADHIGRWHDLRDFLVSKNISFYSHDQRGHGKTEIGVKVSFAPIKC